MNFFHACQPRTYFAPLFFLPFFCISKQGLHAKNVSLSGVKSQLCFLPFFFFPVGERIFSLNFAWGPQRGREREMQIEGKKLTQEINWRNKQAEKSGTIFQSPFFLCPWSNTLFDAPGKVHQIAPHHSDTFHYIQQFDP